jgi:hypothetical protein
MRKKARPTSKPRQGGEQRNKSTHTNTNTSTSISTSASKRNEKIKNDPTTLTCITSKIKEGLLH